MTRKPPGHAFGAFGRAPHEYEHGTVVPIRPGAQRDPTLPASDTPLAAGFDYLGAALGARSLSDLVAAQQDYAARVAAANLEAFRAFWRMWR